MTRQHPSLWRDHYLGAEMTVSAADPKGTRSGNDWYPDDWHASDLCNIIRCMHTYVGRGLVQQIEHKLDS